MPTVSPRALLRLLSLAFLLLLGSGEDGRAAVRERKDGSKTEVIETADFGAALAATPLRLRIDTVTPQPSAPDTNPYGAAIQTEAAPTLLRQSFCSCERAPGEAARPPPLHA